MVVTPNDSIIMKINIPNEIIDLISKNELGFFGLLVYGNKRDADLLSNKLEANLLNSYKNSLMTDSQIVLNPIKLKEFKNLFNGKDLNDSTISAFIWNIVDRKIGFEKLKM